MHNFSHNGQEMKYEALGSQDAETVVIWAHGWGHTHRNLVASAQPLEALAYHIVVDFPGFGESPVPQDTWSPLDYAHFMADFIKRLPQKKVLWVGHSFGCRVGLHLAAHYPDLVHSMCLAAAAGLKRKRGIFQTLYFQSRIYLYKGLRFMTRYGLNEHWIKSKFGSADYKAAGDMRDILVKTVNEDLTETAKAVQCRVRLVFGAHDEQTPPEMGRRYDRYISESEFIQLEGYDHYSILTDGRHHLSRLVKEMI